MEELKEKLLCVLKKKAHLLQIQYTLGASCFYSLKELEIALVRNSRVEEVIKKRVVVKRPEYFWQSPVEKEENCKRYTTVISWEITSPYNVSIQISEEGVEEILKIRQDRLY